MNAPFLLVPLLAALIATSPCAAQTTSATGPQISMDTTVYDYGTIPFGSNGNCSFRFTNTGDAPLVVTSFKTSCGCLAPYYDSEPVLPGKTGTVRLKYDTRRVGPINKSATLYTNAVNGPEILLRIKGTVLPSEGTAP
jgi:hypothetical protein